MRPSLDLEVASRIMLSADGESPSSVTEAHRAYRSTISISAQRRQPVISEDRLACLPLMTL